MAKQPTTFFREVYNYLRHGAGWFLCTLAEVEIFGLSSVVQPDGKVTPLSEEQLNPYNPENLPDFCVLVVSNRFSTFPHRTDCVVHRHRSATRARQA